MAGTGARSARHGGIIEIVKTVIYAVLIAVVVRTVLIEPFNIPSKSMVPSLLVGDFLFVAKYSYGYSRHSLPFSPRLFSGRIFGRQPERGDVAVFKTPGDNKTDYIKRLIGLPGDRIQVKGGILHINGTPVRRERIADYREAGEGRWRSRSIPVARYYETLPGGRRHFIVEYSDADTNDNTPIFVVPPDHYFAMGDNRDNSSDSRAFSVRLDGRGQPMLAVDSTTEITIDSPVLWDVGFVPAENLVGRAEFLFFSVDGSARLWQIWKWPGAIRYGRLFQAIE